MSQSTPVICVTTDKCPAPGSTGNNTDASIQLFCPFTGSSLSNTLLRIGTGIGVQNLTPIPNTHAYLAYSGKDSQDMNAMLLVQGSSSPTWKCRLPESMEGLITSPCGLFIIGAGKSGRCYCWSTFHQGELLRIWTAHYRPVNKVCFSDCGNVLVTGGADGIVHVWSLMDIVSSSSHFTSTLEATAGKMEQNLNPIRTWSQHHLPITALHAMPSSRILSGSSDRQVMILEIFSGLTLARMELPTAISAITTDTVGHRVYIGGSNGRLYLIDLDTYAVASTAESATVIQTKSVHSSYIDEGKESSTSYICELQGHEKAVTCLAILEGAANTGDLEDLLISGGIDGTIRVWDIRARCCVRILRPWTTTTSLNTSNHGGQLETSHPCTSITILPRSDLETHAHRNTIASSSKRKSNLTMEAAILPLQRFTREHQQQRDPLEEACMIIPIKPTRAACVPVVTFAPYHGSRSYSLKKNKRLLSETEPQTISSNPRNSTEHVQAPSIGENKETSEVAAEEIELLKKELQEARETIDRWQKVNNKLAQRLKKASSK